MFLQLQLTLIPSENKLHKGYRLGNHAHFIPFEFLVVACKDIDKMIRVRHKWKNRFSCPTLISGSRALKSSVLMALVCSSFKKNVFFLSSFSLCLKTSIYQHELRHSSYEFRQMSGCGTVHITMPNGQFRVKFSLLTLYKQFRLIENGL